MLDAIYIAFLDFLQYVFLHPDAHAIHASIFVGGLIGFERTYSGSAAGFRTHILVSLASTILTLSGMYLPDSLPLDVIRADPTRMAQGVMTGVGFIGAGVIMKSGLSIRGLTTAASIWITAAIGIMIGMKHYEAVALTVLGVLSVLYMFRWFEKVFPSNQFGKVKVLVDQTIGGDHTRLVTLINSIDGLKIVKSNYGKRSGGLEFRFTLKSNSLKNFRELATLLNSDGSVIEYDIQTIKS